MKGLTATRYSRREYDLRTYDEVFAKYPDKNRYAVFRDNLEKGWSIGLKKEYPNRQKSCNKFSTQQLPLVARQIVKWHEAGYIFGPISAEDAKQLKLTINHFFAVPKGETDVRPILNLSDRNRVGFSINECLHEQLCTVEYVQQLEIIETLMALGQGAWLWAKDLKWGYNNVPIIEKDVKYLAFQFCGRIYCYQVLPMGLASAPKIFTEFMHFVLWAAKNDSPPLHFITVKDADVNLENFGKNADVTEYVESTDDEKTREKIWKIAVSLNYLDDIFGGHRSKILAQAQFDHVEKTLNKIQLQSQLSKARPPSQKQVWLGKEYDTVKQWVKLTEEKLNKYVSGIEMFLKKLHAPQREFLKHIGRARHMGTIYKALNAFARGLERWAYSKRNLQLDDLIHISEAVIRDFEFTIWAMKLAHEEGAPFSSFLKPMSRRHKAEITILTDASLTIGVGGIASTGDYFQNKWSDIDLTEPAKRDIQWRELCGVFMAIHALQDKLDRKWIHVFTDNDSVKWMLIKMRSRLSRPDLQILINKICEILLKRRIELWIDHIPGEDNVCADALSRFFDNPLKSAPFSVTNEINALNSLKKASELAAKTSVNVEFLVFKDDDVHQ